MTHWELLVSPVAVRRTDGRTDGGQWLMRPFIRRPQNNMYHRSQSPLHISIRRRLSSTAMFCQ